MRRSDEHEMDPETIASLEAIDATLAGEPVDPRHAELAELAVLLADERPRIDPAFAHTLDQRVDSQFASTRQAGAVGGASVGRKLSGWLLAGGAAVTALAATVVLVVVFAGGHTSSSTGGPQPLRSIAPDANAHSPGPSSASGSSAASAASQAAPSAASAASQAGPSAASVPPTANGPAPPANGRKIVQSAELYLSTGSGRVDDVAQEVFNVVGQQNGVVVRSSVTQTGGADGNAFFELSMPSSSLPQTMAKLSQLPYARVSSRTDNSQDVTNQHARATRALADARALHTALLKQLADAVTTQQIDSIRARIHDNEQAISNDERALAALNHRIAFSNVSVTIGARARPVVAPHHSGGFTIGRAVHDAGRVLTVAAGVALITLAALVPVALVAALVWWILVMVGHRRRERALDMA